MDTLIFKFNYFCRVLFGENVRITFMCTKNIFEFQYTIKLASTNSLGVFVTTLWTRFIHQPSSCPCPLTCPVLFRACPENVCFCVICFPFFLFLLICFWNLCLVFHIQVNSQGISLFQMGLQDTDRYRVIFVVQSLCCVWLFVTPWTVDYIMLIG